MKQSSAQITKRYIPEDLIGQQIVAVVNFPPKRVAGFKSEVLVLGGVPEAGDVVLLQPNMELPNGTKLVNVKAGNMDIGREYVQCVPFRILKQQRNKGNGCFHNYHMNRLNGLLMKLVAIIIKHLHGNMRSRWTDF